jgi:hypothetical protein
MKVFQIYFKPELVQHCDPLFTPMDNTDNPRPELREWDKWNREHDAIMEQDLDLWGYVSWKFKEKTNLTGKDVFDYVNSNPGYDVYLFNPCIANEALFANSWEQGDIHHANISDIGNMYLKKLGYADYDVKNVLLDRTRTVFANYIIGNKNFWTKFMEFSRRIFTEAETDPEFKHLVFGAGLSNYAHDASLPNFTFLIERLIPTFLDIEGFKVMPYVYTHNTLPAKYQPYIGDITALSDLEVLINRYESDDLYNVWNYYRNKCLNDNRGILGLE